MEVCRGNTVSIKTIVSDCTLGLSAKYPIESMYIWEVGYNQQTTRYLLLEVSVTARGLGKALGT